MLVPVRWLFVYGTLMPGRLRWALVADDVAERRPATVAGILYDTGRGYPAFVPGAPADLVAAASPGASGAPPAAGPAAVEGWLLGFADDRVEAVLDRLDEVEGPDYARVEVTATDGTPAVTYGWVAARSGLAVLDGRWHGEGER